MESSSAVGKSEVNAQDVSTLIPRFLSELDVKRNTKRIYESALRQFLFWLKRERRLSPSREDIIAYRESLLAAGKSACTVSNYLTVVRVFFRWFARLGGVNIADGVRNVRPPRAHKKDVLSKEQIRAVLNTIDKSTLPGLRDYALINLLVRTGLRPIEVVRAVVDDVRTSPELREGERLLYVQGKWRDDKDDFVVLTAEAYRPLAAYLQKRGAGKSAPLFCSHSNRNRGGRLTTISISRIVKSAMRAAGLDSPRLTAYSLRHTALMLAVQAGAPLEQVQAMARHMDVHWTLRYYYDVARMRDCSERHIKF